MFIADLFFLAFAKAILVQVQEAYRNSKKIIQYNNNYTMKIMNGPQELFSSWCLVISLVYLCNWCL